MGKKIITNTLECQNLSGDVVEFINTDGFKAVRYRDEYVGGDWLTPTNSSAPEPLDVTIAGLQCRMYSFDGVNTEEIICNHFEIPHDMAIDVLNAGGNDINGDPVELEVHIHWLPSTNDAGTVKWFFDYTILPAQGAPIAGGTMTATHTILPNQQYWHFIDAFITAGSAINIPAPVGGWRVGDIIRFRIRRTPTTTGDDYTKDALFIKAALHVPTNDFGSRQRYVK
jgi:hypothetical protein